MSETLNKPERRSEQQRRLPEQLFLITDGTVTELLEALAGESMGVEKVASRNVERITELKPDELEAELDADLFPVLDRQIFLRGADSGQRWLYARSAIIINHLPEAFRRDLLESKQPIGKLWHRHRVETYKVLVGSGEVAAGDLAEAFGVDHDHPLLWRTYQVFSNRRLMMVITEKLPRQRLRYL